MVLGDRQTGKTAIALDTIINQKGKDVICIYCAIGQKRSTVANVVDILSKAGAMDYSIIVSATASGNGPTSVYCTLFSCCNGRIFYASGKGCFVRI